MAVEAVAAGVNGGGGSLPGGGAPEAALRGPGAAGTPQVSTAELSPAPRDVALESRGNRVAGPAETAVRAAPPEVSSAPNRSGPSIGDKVIDGVSTLQKGDAAWRTGDAGRAQPSNEPSLKVASREPGPAAAQLKPDASHGLDVAGHPTTQPGQSQNPSFDEMVNQLHQVSGQVVQVSVVSKTTSSFTGSLNKLLSSG